MSLPFRLLQVYSLLDKYDDNTPPPLDLQASAKTSQSCRTLVGKRYAAPRTVWVWRPATTTLIPLCLLIISVARGDRKNPRFLEQRAIKCLSSSCPNICQRTNRLDCDCVDLHVQIEVVHS